MGQTGDSPIDDVPDRQWLRCDRMVNDGTADNGDDGGESRQTRDSEDVFACFPDTRRASRRSGSLTRDRPLSISRRSRMPVRSRRSSRCARCSNRWEGSWRNLRGRPLPSGRQCIVIARTRIQYSRSGECRGIFPIARTCARDVSVCNAESKKPKYQRVAEIFSIVGPDHSYDSASDLGNYQEQGKPDEEITD